MSETISKAQSFSIHRIYAVASKDVYQKKLNHELQRCNVQVETNKDDNKMAHNQTAEGNGLIFSCTVHSLISPSFYGLFYVFVIRWLCASLDDVY